MIKDIPKMIYPFNHNDLIQRYEIREPSTNELENEPNEYCMYLRDVFTGELIRICDSDLPF